MGTQLLSHSYVYFLCIKKDYRNFLNGVLQVAFFNNNSDKRLQPLHVPCFMFETTIRKHFCCFSYAAVNKDPCNYIFLHLPVYS